MDLIREESSMADSSLYNHRAVFQKQPSTQNNIEAATNHQPKINTLKFTMSSKKKAAEEEKKLSGSQKSQFNAELSKMLNFSKRLDELRPGSNKSAISKQSKFSLSYSLKSTLATSNKKNTSMGLSESIVRRHPSIAATTTPTDTLSTRLTPSLNTFGLGDTQSPVFQKMVLSKRDKVFQMNFSLKNQGKMDTDFKAFGNFKVSCENIGKFILNAKYPYIFIDIFQTYQNDGKLNQALEIEEERLHNYDYKTYLKWRDMMKKRAESNKIRRLKI